MTIACDGCHATIEEIYLRAWRTRILCPRCYLDALDIDQRAAGTYARCPQCGGMGGHHRPDCPQA